MKKLFMTFAAVVLTGSLFAGGLVTNTNQSALFTRLQSRNASTVIDAVYYNPAGLTKLEDGFHFSLNNQTIGQKKTITTQYPYLVGSPVTYSGSVSAPIFPSVYAAYKTGNLVFSAGFNPVGGGGGAKYEAGLPSFEMIVTDLIPLLNGQGIPTTTYSSDIFFEGSSVYFGFQGNVSYKINDMISVAAGLRVASAANTYQGYLKNIRINPNYPAFGAAFNGSLVKAPDFFTAGAATLTGLATGANGFVTGLAPIIAGGGGAVLVSDGTTVGLTAVQVAQIQGILGAAGLTPAQIGAATISSASTALAAAAPVFTGKATAMTGYAAATQDLEVDAEESGMGYTPIISVNFSPSDKLNIAMKYEFKTKLELTTKLIDNKGGGIFIEGEKVIADMPALLAIGVEYMPTDKWMMTGSLNYYFDKGVDYDKSEALEINMIDKNFIETGLGIQFSPTENFRVSVGYLNTTTGVNDEYQSDLKYSLNTNSIGGGMGFTLSPKIDLNLGGSYTFYKEGSVDYSWDIGGSGILAPATDTYLTKTWVVSAGLNFRF